MARSDHEVSADQLRLSVDSQGLGIESSENLEPVKGIIGQKRAVSALHFGLNIVDNGFNIYVAGPAGIGKMTAVQSFLEDVARPKETPPDWCYVNNFDDPYHPRVIQLPAGRGRKLQKDMEGLVDHVRLELPRSFEQEAYGSKKNEILAEVKKQREAVLEQLNARAAKAGFGLTATSLGIVILPVQEGRPLSEGEFLALPPAAREELKKRQEALQDELRTELKGIRDLERATQRRVEELDRRVTLYVVGAIMDELTEQYHDLPVVTQYLQSVQQDILNNVQIFRSGSAPPSAPLPGGTSMPVPWAQDLPFRRYQVNLLVDNGQQKGAPVIVELSPTYNNLFGRIEKETQYGTLSTDFTLLRAGSLHRANGGYLVLPVEDVLRNLLCWDGLKRAIRNREIQLEELGERLGSLATKSLQPQPVPLNLKVVLVGRPLLYYLLQASDEDFPELFKIKADFDTRMPRNPENMRDFLAFLCGFCRKEKLLALNSRAIARILEEASRMAEDQEMLSTRFGAISDVIREAHHWALQDQASEIDQTHVRKALDEKVYRSNLVEEHIREMIFRGALLIDTAGEAIGQVNGLSVISLGDYSFGRPSRITATVRPGREGILDIEREVELGGPLHSKGMMILSGYLSQKFATHLPLTLSARIVFEQSYQGVDGDSASSTELYALLSALSGVPIKQGISVTGSVNQRGEVQSIGGVNEKIEGVFEVCKSRGLTGEQGVLIPLSNLYNLMLKEEVVEAVRAEQFHVWGVETIDQGIEVLTGLTAGKRDPAGNFPEGSINSLVEKRLIEFAECLKRFGQQNDEKKER